MPSVALLRGDEVLALRVAPPRADAAVVVLPAVEAVLEQAGVALSRVGLFAVAIGPGSFTGLRVGLATVKGLAFGSETPVAAVPTLAALCFGAGSTEGPVAALLDARRGEVYAAAYGPGAEGTGEAELVPAGLYTPAMLAGRLPAGCGFAGDGAVLFAAPLAAAGYGSASNAVLEPAAAAVGRLGLRRLARGEARPAETLAPRYLRRAEAEARRLGVPLEDEKPF